MKASGTAMNKLTKYEIIPVPVETCGEQKNKEQNVNMYPMIFNSTYASGTNAEII